MSKVAVIYWSSTGNTQTMAETFADAIGVEAISVSDFDSSTIDEYTHLALGCSSCGEEELDDSEFEPFFVSILPNLKDKNIALFGSYGWGDGEWMRTWEQRVIESGAKLFETGQIALEYPEDDVLESLQAFAKAFVLE